MNFCTLAFYATSALVLAPTFGAAAEGVARHGLADQPAAGKAAAVAVAPGPDLWDAVALLAPADDLPPGAPVIDDAEAGKTPKFSHLRPAAGALLAAAKVAADVRPQNPAKGQDLPQGPVVDAAGRAAAVADDAGRGGAPVDSAGGLHASGAGVLVAAMASAAGDIFETVPGAASCGRNEILSSDECVAHANSKGFASNSRVDVVHVPHGCVCDHDRAECWYNLHYYGHAAQNGEYLVCKELESLDPSLPVPAEGDCDEQLFYIETLIENADYRGSGPYTGYTNDESVAQADCQTMSDCLGYWLREHPTYDGKVHRGWFLLFEGVRSWESGRGTVKIAKKKMTGVQVCVPEDPATQDLSIKRSNGAMAISAGDLRGSGADVLVAAAAGPSDIVQTGLGASTCGLNSNLSADECSTVATDKRFGFTRVNWNMIPHGCICDDVSSNCYYNVNFEGTATGNEYIVCRDLVLLDPGHPIPDTANCGDQTFYIERLIENAEYYLDNRYGRIYADYTDDESVAQADCQAMSECLGYWLREHNLANGEVHRGWFLLFEGVRSWESGGGTTKIVKMKVSSVQVCLSQDAVSPSWV